MSEELKLCASCGEEYSKDDLTEFDGEFYCSDCLEEQTRICSHCGERIWNDDNFGNGGFPLCEHCYRQYTPPVERYPPISLGTRTIPRRRDPYCEIERRFDDEHYPDYPISQSLYFLERANR